jgi:DNA-binding response OmpR family regulator
MGFNLQLIRGDDMTAAKPTGPPDVGPTVLIVEDDVLIALSLEDALIEAGFRVIGPARSVVMATDLLRVEHPDVAVLDYNLLDDTVTSVAKALMAMDIPFLLSTGRDESEIADPVFDHVRNLGKTPRPATLVRALDELLASDRHPARSDIARFVPPPLDFS